MRRYVVVKHCELFAGTHQHLITDDNEYCGAVGKWVKDSTGKSYKELKDKWFPKKTKHERKEERKEREEQEGT